MKLVSPLEMIDYLQDEFGNTECLMHDVPHNPVQVKLLISSPKECVGKDEEERTSGAEHGSVKMIAVARISELAIRRL